MSSPLRRVRAIDSHTGGEPTRVIVEGGPDLGGGPLPQRLEVFRTRHDEFRSAVVNEPRGSEIVVGGLLCPPQDADSAAAVIFFNNRGYLGMCGHGAIGLVATLQHLGRLDCGRHRIETPVGDVTAELFDDGRIAVRNVPCHRTQADVSINVDELGEVTGDVAWGGNWFFLVKRPRPRLTLAKVPQWTRWTTAIQTALWQKGVTGEGGQPIDHIELFDDPASDHADSRNFVLCPGGAYDRSPCGTGSSAKLACLAADGLLQPGQRWRQESIVGSVFECSYEFDASGQVVPTIVSPAYVTAETTLILDPRDPFCAGFRFPAEQDTDAARAASDMQLPNESGHE